MKTGLLVRRQTTQRRKTLDMRLRSCSVYLCAGQLWRQVEISEDMTYISLVNMPKRHPVRLPKDGIQMPNRRYDELGHARLDVSF